MFGQSKGINLIKNGFGMLKTNKMTKVSILM